MLLCSQNLLPDCVTPLNFIGEYMDTLCYWMPNPVLANGLAQLTQKPIPRVHMHTVVSIMIR